MISPQSRSTDDILMTSETDMCGNVATRKLNPFD